MWRFASSLAQLSLKQLARPHLQNPQCSRRGLSYLGDIELLGRAIGMTEINSYNQTGFIVNGISVTGSILCFRKFFLLWDVKKAADITPDTLALVPLVKPKPDLLLIGTGSVCAMELISPELRKFLKSQNIALDIMDTRHAASTFNVLNAEGRSVVAALLSMEPFDLH